MRSEENSQQARNHQHCWKDPQKSAEIVMIGCKFIYDDEWRMNYFEAGQRYGPGRVT